VRLDHLLSKDEALTKVNDILGRDIYRLRRYKRPLRR